MSCNEGLNTMTGQLAKVDCSHPDKQIQAYLERTFNSPMYPFRTLEIDLRNAAASLEKLIELHSKWGTRASEISAKKLIERVYNVCGDALLECVNLEKECGYLKENPDETDN